MRRTERGRDLIGSAVVAMALAGVGSAGAQSTPKAAPARVPAAKAAEADATQWWYPDRDPGAGRHSPATQITPKNIAGLQVAWTFDAGASNLQATPLVIKGLMYITAGRSVFALEPETGTPVWKWTAADPVSRRGVAYWPGDASTPARLYMGAGDKMVALDATTGQVVTAFGANGFVDLKPSVRGDVDGRFSLISPPTVFEDILITGGNNEEQSPSFGLYGDIRGWDARTGKLLWSFHTVPRAGEPGVDTWEGESWKNRSGTNMWAFFSIDVERGLVYVPLGSPTSDYYGADRPGDNLYGNSLVALDAATGRLKWYRQLVHHDLWDFDLPGVPTLFEIRQKGKAIPAVAVTTKMNLMFVFNRVTGEPIFGIEERPVPQSTVPGERSSKTQPFPLKPAPLGRTTFDPARDFYDLTPEHAAYCRGLWEKNGMYTKGMYTPPGTEGVMVTFPSTLGGGNWNGNTFDPTLGLLFTNVMSLGQVARMEQRPERQTGKTTWGRVSPWGGPVGRFWNPDTKIPCSAPPWGELLAVNVATGDIAWHVPLGVIDTLKEKGFDKTGTVNIGGAVSTASGLLFIGGSNDKRFRAFESKTGRMLWETTLEASVHMNPMTFVGRDGRQYVVVGAGGGSFLGSSPGTKYVSFALPKATPSAQGK